MQSRYLLKQFISEMGLAIAKRLEQLNTGGDIIKKDIKSA
jgi:hypothetical protein